MAGRRLAHSVNYLAKHRKTIQPVRTTKLIRRHQESAGSFGVSKAHIGIMGDRLLTVGAVTFGIIIPIAFLVIAWFSM
jgi:hypothetical protein